MDDPPVELPSVESSSSSSLSSFSTRFVVTVCVFVDALGFASGVSPRSAARPEMSPRAVLRFVLASSAAAATWRGVFGMFGAERIRRACPVVKGY